MKTFAALLCGIITLTTPTLRAASLYTITPLGFFHDGGTEFVGLDDQGRVVGTSAAHLFLWQNGEFTDLHDFNLMGDYSTATAMNNKGQIVGRCREGAVRITLSVSGAPLVKLYGPSSFFYDINDNGQIVGFQAVYSGDPRRGNVARAYLWNGGTTTPLGTIPLRDEAAGVAINNAGQVVVDGSNGGPRGSGPVFLWTAASGLTDLNVYALAEAINGDGAIAGQDNGGHAFLFDGGRLTDLGTFGGSTSHALDINDAGQIVGTARTTNEADHAFLWDNGMMTDLNDVIPANSGWELRRARAINNHGEILGVGVFSNVVQGFLLHPPIKLSVDPIIRSQRTTLRVTGANPGDMVLFFMSERGLGRGPCLRHPFNLCLDIRHPSLLGHVVADFYGRAAMSRMVPRRAKLMDLAFQSLVYHEQSWTKTDPIVAFVLPGDG